MIIKAVIRHRGIRYVNSALATSGILPATFHSASQASLFHLLSFPYRRKAGPILLFCNYFPGTPHPLNHKSVIAIPSAPGFTLLLSVSSQFPQKPKTCFLNGHVQPTTTAKSKQKPQGTWQMQLLHISQPQHSVAAAECYRPNWRQILSALLWIWCSQQEQK